MKFEWRNNRDFWAGLFLIVTGAVAMFISRDYPMGSALRMGPGYFPMVLGGIVVVFGIYVLAQGVINKELVKGNWAIRPLIILPASTALFGWMMDEVGFIPATIVLVYFSSLAGKDFKFLEVTISAAVLTISCTGVFIYGLGLPYPLLKGM